MITLLPLLLACKDTPQDTAAPVVTGEGLFAEGCPPEGQAIARAIGVDATLPGKVAVGTRGDLLLANEHAAYVVTEPDKGSTYYYYGGIVADAVPMDGCTPATDDKLDEVGLVLADIDIGDVEGSVVRAFRGQSVEVIADGSDGGPATVRVRGIDDNHWLVEYTLISDAVNSGGRPFAPPYGVEVVVDYTLRPDSPVLQMDVTVTNPTDQDLELVHASLLSFGETLDMHAYATGELSISRLDLDLGIPWIVATDGDGAWAYAIERGSLAWAGISGVQIAVDALQATATPFDLPAGGGEDSRRAFLSVGSTDGSSATAPLADINPVPIPNQGYTASQVTGVVVDPSGQPVPGARVYIEADSGSVGWGVLDEAISDESGQFTASVPAFDSAWEFRLSPWTAGRDTGETVAVSPGDTDVTLALPALGELQYNITNEDGEPSPARLHLLRDDGQVQHRWLTDTGAEPMPPGTYDYTATRGYEYAPVYGTLTVPPDGSAQLDLVMDRMVDSSGYLTVDTHVHSSDSSDSDVSQEGQLRRAAAHGLDVVVHTEHENLVDRSAVPAEEGLDAWVTNVIGEEVTATMPEHLTMFPAVPDGSVRGGIVEWYGQDLDEIFGMMRERSGGGVNLLNHPGYLNTISWNRVNAAPDLDDPTLLGLAPDAAIWSWDMDGLEVQNGHSNIFASGNRRFDNWMSMVNAGHELVAVGCSDDHGGWQTGFPRSYYATTARDVREFSEIELVDAFQGGQLVSSTGAFMEVLVNDRVGLGETTTDTDGSAELWVQVQAIPEIDVTEVVVYVNCDRVLTIPADEPDGVVKLGATVELPLEPGDNQIVVAAFGEERYPAGLPSFNPNGVPRALSSPIFVDGDGDGVWSGAAGRECSY